MIGGLQQFAEEVKTEEMKTFARLTSRLQTLRPPKSSNTPQNAHASPMMPDLGNSTGTVQIAETYVFPADYRLPSMGLTMPPLVEHEGEDDDHNDDPEDDEVGGDDDGAGRPSDQGRKVLRRGVKHGMSLYLRRKEMEVKVADQLCDDYEGMGTYIYMSGGCTKLPW